MIYIPPSSIYFTHTDLEVVLLRFIFHHPVHSLHTPIWNMYSCDLHSTIQFIVYTPQFGSCSLVMYTPPPSAYFTHPTLEVVILLFEFHHPVYVLHTPFWNLHSCEYSPPSSFLFQHPFYSNSRPRCTLHLFLLPTSMFQPPHTTTSTPAEIPSSISPKPLPF